MNAGRLIQAIFFLFFPVISLAGEVTAAIASNFTAPMKVIAEKFEAATGHRAALAFGSSGKFYAQIVNGAPYEVFLSADRQKPRKLEQEGWAVPGSRFTYALGALVLWSADAEFDRDLFPALREGRYNRLAIANPRFAPYGQAAIEVLESMGIQDVGKARLVQGENISQTYQFVSTGNADLGFVALSQVINEKPGTGATWLVPADLYKPIRQDAVLLKAGEHNLAAIALMDYLKSEEAQTVIAAYGYNRRSEPQ